MPPHPPKISTGLLMFRRRRAMIEVFLAHPGGPFFQAKDEGVWGIPKGLVETGEEYLDSARREFQEETGITPQGPYIDLGQVQQNSGKIVYAWGFEGDCDSSRPIVCNHFQLEWPPKSGKMQSFPEIDRAQFFTPDAAAAKMMEAQKVFLDRLLKHLQT